MIASVALAFLAASSAPAADSAAPAAASVKEKKICRKEEAMTGSITAKRVCKIIPFRKAITGEPP